MLQEKRKGCGGSPGFVCSSRCKLPAIEGISQALGLLCVLNEWSSHFTGRKMGALLESSLLLSPSKPHESWKGSLLICPFPLIRIWSSSFKLCFPHLMAASGKAKETEITNHRIAQHSATEACGPNLESQEQLGVVNILKGVLGKKIYTWQMTEMVCNLRTIQSLYPSP